MKRKAILLLVIVAGLLAAMTGTARLTDPPPLRGSTAAGQFDSVRAKAALALLLGDQRPHPADTLANDAVRDRLLDQLRALGLQPQVLDRFACGALMKQRGVACARVRNVRVSFGPEAGRHLLVNAHYDSVPVGPGAADDGIGVATLLELARLLSDSPPARPVTLLFNEGEELGLLGARAFLDGDPLAGRVDSLINLEARGVTGPVNMFETSVPNRAPVALFADTVVRPVANSLAVSAYRLLPNYTDVNIFADRNWLTLNFAPVGNETRYHSPGDELAALDPATLQHMGDQALALVRRLGDEPATAPAPAPATVQAESLFMNVGPWGLLVAPMGLGMLLFAALVVAAGVMAVKKRGQFGVGLALLSLVCAVFLAWAGLTFVGLIRQAPFWRAHQSWVEFAIYAGAIAAALTLFATLGRTVSRQQLRAGFWFVFLILGGALWVIAPGGLIYFLFPPLIALAGMIAARRWPSVETPAAILAALLLYVTLGALLGLLEELLNAGPLWVFAPFGALILLPWLIELKPLIEAISRRLIVEGAAVLVVASWAATAGIPAYSANRQQQWTLQYVAEQGRAANWSIVNDRAPLPSQVKQLRDWKLGKLAIGERLRWIAPAPPIEGLTFARVDRVAEARQGNRRLISLRLTSNGADTVTLLFDKKVPVVALGTPGQLRRFDQGVGPGLATLSCTGRSCDGAVFQMLVATRDPVQVQLLATRWALPPEAGQLKAAQPPFAQAQYLPDATITLARQGI